MVRLPALSWAKPVVGTTWCRHHACMASCNVNIECLSTSGRVLWNTHYLWVLTMDSRWRARFRIPAPKCGSHHGKFQVHIKIYAFFSLPSQKCTPFSLIGFICFLLCYFNWVIVNPASPLAIFFPRAGYEVWDLPELRVSGQCRSGRDIKCCILLQG